MGLCLSSLHRVVCMYVCNRMDLRSSSNQSRKEHLSVLKMGKLAWIGKRLGAREHSRFGAFHFSLVMDHI
jgi:hypothetical protein